MREGVKSPTDKVPFPSPPAAAVAVSAVSPRPDEAVKALKSLTLSAADAADGVVSVSGGDAAIQEDGGRC